jgi:hypothetical protein
MEILGYFSIRRPDVVHETIDGETVIVNLENGIYYSLRESAVDVWGLIEAGANLDEITSVMTDRYEGSAEVMREAVTELLLSLQREGLVEVSSTKRPGSQTSPAAQAGKKRKFEVPLLEKYSDMQQLLLLDPVHEVDEEGWPHKAEDEGQGNVGQG